MGATPDQPDEAGVRQQRRITLSTRVLDRTRHAASPTDPKPRSARGIAASSCEEWLRSASIAQLVALALATRSFTKIKLSAKFVLPRQVPEWIRHDRRRTATTVMADGERLSIAPHVVAEILNHVAGTIFGMAAIYNRNEIPQGARVGTVVNLISPSMREAQFDPDRAPIFSARGPAFCQ
jgi:hypothetical protein